MGRCCAYGGGEHRRLREAAQRCGGDDLCELPFGAASFLWPHGETMIEALVTADGVTVLRAYLVIAPRIEPGLTTEIALFSAGLKSGRLEIDDVGDVSFIQRLPGWRAADELTAELSAFSEEAERLGVLLRDRLGGHSSLDVVMHGVRSRLCGCPAAAMLEIN